jgi:hypothetical protein
MANRAASEKLEKQKKKQAQETTTANKDEEAKSEL